MAKTKVSEWDSVAANNTDINSININEGCPPSTINNAIRETMAQIKNWQDGSSGDSWTSTGVILSNGTFTANGTVNINNKFRINGSSGVAGQVLTSAGSTTYPAWQTLGTVSAQNANSVNISGTVQTDNFNATGIFKVDGSTGAAGQVLVSTGSNAHPEWTTLQIFVTGMIMLWSGSTSSIPSGWALCNGSSGTPDLRNRFIVGAGSTYAVNATGGSANATLPSHSHTFSGSTGAAGSHNHYVTSQYTSSSTFTSNTQTFAWASAGGLGNSDYRGGARNERADRARSSDIGNHVHSMSGSTAAAGSSSTNANLPPYYALAYIMKL
jgi:microcystin-dependent protein